MKSMEKELMYWFYLYPSVYISIKEHVLLYDTDKNTYYFVNDSSLIHIFESLLDITNMGTVKMDFLTAHNKTIVQLVKENYGVLIEANTIENKPYTLPLVCGMNIDFDRKVTDNTFYDLVLSKDLSKIPSRCLSNTKCR